MSAPNNPSAVKKEADLARASRDKRLAKLDFDQSPFTIAWELTQACAYACAHCRADARPHRHPEELDTNESFALIDDIACFDPKPILVLTGGDPLMRRDVFEIAAYANERGLKVALTPTATALTTKKRMAQARDAGVRRVAFSIDAPDAELHDSFRGFSGSFERTMSGIKATKDSGLPLQINTTVCTLNVAEIEKMIPLLCDLEAIQWSVFFLVPTGRGKNLQPLSAQEHERLIRRLDQLAQELPFDLKITAAPAHRRIALERTHGGELAGAGYHFSDGLRRPAKGVNDARGFMFISHRGDVMPSGFLPISGGNVRKSSVVQIYRNSTLFKELRDPNRLKGKCGDCEYRDVCGGSRARAYAITGDYLESDPSCPYQPAQG